MKRYFLLICCMLWVQLGWTNPGEKLRLANELYATNRYSEAIDAYKELVGQNLESATLYYNLGNAYFKVHDIKSAILYFEKALLISPGDEDIRYNLSIAQSRLVDKIDVLPELFLITWLKYARDMFPSDKWAMFSLILFLMCLGFFLMFMFSRKSGNRKLAFFLGVIFFFSTTFSIGFALARYKVQTSQSTGIVFKSTITVKSSPDESGTNLFILHEGTKVQVLDELGRWIEIRVPDGKRGWMPSDAIERI